MNKLLLILMISPLIACTTVMDNGKVGTDPFEIHGLIFKNSGQADIQGVRLTLQDLGRFIACDNIVSGGICSTEFPSRKYSNEKLSVAWSTAHRNFLIQDRVISNKLFLKKGEVVTVYVDIANDGALSVSLINR